MRLVIIILCIACLASIAYIRKKGRKTQHGGADPALVGMLFLVLVSGGLGIAYELNDDFKDWVNKHIGGDDGSGVKTGCAKYTTEASCPSPTCKWKDSACKDKDSEVQTTGQPTLTCDSHRTQPACAKNKLCQWAASPSPGQCSNRPPDVVEDMVVRFNTPYQIVSTTHNDQISQVSGMADFNLPGKLIAFLSNGSCQGTGGTNNGWCVGYAVDGFNRMGPEGDTKDRKPDATHFKAGWQTLTIKTNSLKRKDGATEAELKVRGNTKAFKFINYDVPESTEAIKYSDVFKIEAIHPPSVPLEYKKPKILRKGPYVVNWDLGSANSVPDIVSLDVDDLTTSNYADNDTAGIQDNTDPPGLDPEKADDQVKWMFVNLNDDENENENVTINTDLYIRLARDVPNDSKLTPKKYSHTSPYGSGPKYLTPWYATEIGRNNKDNGRWARVDNSVARGRLMPISDGRGTPNKTNLMTQGVEIPYVYHVVAIRPGGNGGFGSGTGQNGANESMGYRWKIQHACGDAEENMKVPVSPCPFKLKPKPGPHQEVCDGWAPGIAPRWCGPLGIHLPKQTAGHIRTGHYYRDIFASSITGPESGGGYSSTNADYYKQGKCPGGSYSPEYSVFIQAPAPGAPYGHRSGNITRDQKDSIYHSYCQDYG